MPVTQNAVPQPCIVKYYIKDRLFRCGAAFRACMMTSMQVRVVASRSVYNVIPKATSGCVLSIKAAQPSGIGPDC